MTADTTLILNFAVELSGVVLCTLAILQVLLSKLDQQTRRYFLLIYGGLFALAASNMAGLLMRGLPGARWRAALYASNFIEFLMPTALLYVVTCYLLSIVDPKKQLRALRAFLPVLLLLDAFLLIVSQFTGFYYWFDESNVYHRGAAYPAGYLAAAVILGIDMYLLFRCRDAMTQKERAAFWVYFAVPTVSIVLQNIQYGLNFTIFSAVFAGIVLYAFIVDSQRERYYRQREENTQLKVDIMLSQIQPHFLYNTLGVIEDLCDVDSAAAKAATATFSRYLRGNMDSLSAQAAIPFEQELAHTKGYLELERLRFEGALQVRYEIVCTSFTLPTLTLQPLVENAVRHGVRGSANGKGTVTISAREYADRYEVCVTDDGPGFDPARLPDDGRAHMGIRNVRERLRRLCGGELLIRSAVGEGTTATILLPKEN